MKLVDSHVHIGKYRISSPEIYGWLQVSVDDLIDYMSEQVISDAWLLSHPSTLPNYKLNGNIETLLAASEYEGLHPFCVIKSRNTKILDKYVNDGCQGVGEIKEKKAINDPDLMAVLRAAQDHNLPVLLHMTDKYCYNKDFQIIEVLDKIHTPIIFHGWGWWNMIDKKIPNLLDQYDNIYMDISANSGRQTLMKIENDPTKFLENYSERILFATDFPMLTTYDGTQFGVNQHHVNLVKSFVIDKQARENILFRNAEKLIK